MSYVFPIFPRIQKYQFIYWPIPTRRQAGGFYYEFVSTKKDIDSIQKLSDAVLMKSDNLMSVFLRLR